MTSIPVAHDPQLELLVPDEGDVADPELSMVVPALNEGLTIGDFIEWCKEGLAKAGMVKGEILIIDSSTDDTPRSPSRTVRGCCASPKRGLGRAYIDSLPLHPRQVRHHGRLPTAPTTSASWAPFVEKFREGFEFIMGSRFRGYIEPGAMPPLHRYLGTPVTTWILNVIFSSHFSDIHCGMRGITLEALEAHGPALAVVGVRVRDGAEVGAHGAARRARSPSVS